MPRKRAVRSKPPPSPPPLPPEFLDYRCPSDDAWYSVDVRLEANDVLRVMHVNFSSEYDETFKPDDFSNEKELEEFSSRFRRTSKQLQDEECRKVVKGLLVNVSHTFAENDIRFYDAVVDGVDSSEHILAEGQCSCIFVILWQHGPLSGKRTSTGINNVCLLQPKNLEIDPTVEKFLEIVRQSLDARKLHVNQTVTHLEQNIQHDASKACITPCLNRPSVPAVEHLLSKPLDVPCDLDNVTSKVSSPSCSSGPPESAVDCQLKKQRVSLHNREDAGTSKQTNNISRTPIVGRVSKCRSGQDVSLGSESSYNKNSNSEETYYFFRIENLEKDLSPGDIMDFILEKTSISCQVSVCPGLSHEISSRGTILVAAKDDADVIFDFLHDSKHMITSARGRPWVMDLSWCAFVNGVLPKYEMPSRNKKEHHFSKLRLVQEGTTEFEQATLLRTLQMEFHDHVNKSLLRRLMEEEERIMQWQLQ